jgi:quinol monooxygenase YgiN
MIICYGRYPILDPSVDEAFTASSRRFEAAGLGSPGCAGFYFGDDLFEPDLVHMIHRWADEAAFGVFRTSVGHDLRVAETDAFGEARQVVREDLVFFRGAEDGSEEGNEVCCHLMYDADPADADFVESCRRFQKLGLSSPGNGGFAFGRDQQNPRTVHLWHRWATKDEFDAFMESPGHQTRRAEVDAKEAAGEVKRAERRILQGVVTRRIQR